MRHTSYLLALILFLLAPHASSQEDGQQRLDDRPNIVFIMADDHAQRGVSCYGSDLIQTPNIDRIAREGVRCTQSFVTNAICAPSRAVLLTGKYSHQNGLRDNRDVFDGSQVTFPKLLQRAGYQTALVGKWHLKSSPQGFDYWNILPGQGEYYNPRFIEMGDTSEHIGYVTDLTTEFAMKWIRQRDPAKPFCLLFHHKAPHRNWMPDTAHLSMFSGVDLPLPATLFDTYESRSAAAREQEMEIARHLAKGFDLKLPVDYVARDGSDQEIRPGWDAVRTWKTTYGRMTPGQRTAWEAAYGPENDRFIEAGLTGRDLTVWKYQRYIKDYLRCVASIDDNIGRFLQFLDQQGLTDNTLLVYTSDQGFFLGEHGWYDKRFMYEESLGTPLLIRHPRSIPAGSVVEKLVLNLDFAPTFLDYAGVDIPEAMQGASLRPLLEGNGQASWRSSIYYHYYEYPHGWHNVMRHYGIRTDRHKLIHYYNDINAWELYDLHKDPGELQNLYDHPEYRKTVATLRQELDSLRTAFQDTE
jgi:arylsulfatase A-like enzyme